MRQITVDVETQGVFRGPIDPTALELTVACIHDSSTGQMLGFFRDELSSLWPILERADSIIGYNSEHFDIPVLSRYYTGDLTKIKHVDLMKEVKNVLGRRLKLDNLAEATLGRKKTSNGLEAVRWWEQGLREKVRDYCMADVAITRELYDYALKNGSLKYRDFDGVRDIKLDTSTWELMPAAAPTLTHTLPF
ncbi:MAG: ribonuclease H-like domain-containing protein [Patescibacteria group bacterium]|nr:ribonuclease H-like domain-containing protein [Patescibacteria group bacterium]